MTVMTSMSGKSAAIGMINQHIQIITSIGWVHMSLALMQWVRQALPTWMLLQRWACGISQTMVSCMLHMEATSHSGLQLLDLDPGSSCLKVEIQLMHPYFVWFSLTALVH
jgi:hypothetical protein